MNENPEENLNPDFLKESPSFRIIEDENFDEFVQSYNQINRLFDQFTQPQDNDPKTKPRFHE